MTINILQMLTLISKNPLQSDVSARSMMIKIFFLNRGWFLREHGHIDNGSWEGSYLED